MGRTRPATPAELATLEQHQVTTPEAARALSLRRWRTVRPPAFKGEWAELFDERVADLLEVYGERGPQYGMLAELSAGLYVQIKRMEATGAIRGLESMDKIIERMRRGAPMGEIDEELAIALAAQRELADAAEAIKVYLRAIEQVRKLIDQAQRYTEARKSEIVLVEVNSAVVKTLRIVEDYVDKPTWLAIITEVEKLIAG